MKSVMQILRFLIVAAVSIWFIGSPSLAGNAAVDGLVEAKLRPGWTTAAGTRMVALHLALAPGWKTYWRAPGDTGIAPLIDWSGSRNLAGVVVHWPRPHVYNSNGLRTVGYKGELVLPLELTPNHPGETIDFRANVEMGICDTICVPATLQFVSVLNGAGTSDPMIETALARQPVPAGRAGVGSVTCRFDPIPDGLRLTTAIQMPSTGGIEAALVETADPRVWVSEADVVRSGPLLRITADLVPPRGATLAIDRDGLRFTVLGSRQAVDISGCTLE